MRSWYAKPQSSSSHRLNARRMWIDASMSGCIGPSMHTPCDGNNQAASTPCSSITASRASRSYHSGCSAGSSHASSLPRRSLSLRAGEVVVERAGPRAQVHVTRTRDDRVQPLAVEHVARLAVDVDERHPTVGELRVAVARERVARLPVVVVGVEDRRDLRRCRSSSSTLPQSVPCRSSCAGRRLGALTVDERGHTVHDDPVVARWPSGPGATRRPGSRTAAPGRGSRRCRGRRRSRRPACPRRGSPGPSGRRPSPGTPERRQCASSSDMISYSRTQWASISVA